MRRKPDFYTLRPCSSVVGSQIHSIDDGTNAIAPFGDERQLNLCMRSARLISKQHHDAFSVARQPCKSVPCRRRRLLPTSQWEETLAQLHAFPQLLEPADLLCVPGPLRGSEFAQVSQQQRSRSDCGCEALLNGWQFRMQVSDEHCFRGH